MKKLLLLIFVIVIGTGFYSQDVHKHYFASNKDGYRLNRIKTYQGSSRPLYEEIFVYNENGLLDSIYRSISGTIRYIRIFNYNFDSMSMSTEYVDLSGQRALDVYYFKEGKLIFKHYEREMYSKSIIRNYYTYSKDKLIAVDIRIQEYGGKWRSNEKTEYAYERGKPITAINARNNQILQKFHWNKKRLDSITHFIHNNDKVSQWLQRYTYNDKGQVISVEKFSDDGFSFGRTKYEYNDIGLLEKSIYSDDTGTLSLTYYYEKGNGNANFIIADPEKSWPFLPLEKKNW